MAVFTQEVVVTLLDKRIFRTEINVRKQTFVSRATCVREAIAALPRWGGLWYRNHFISWHAIFAVTLPGESKEPFDGQGNQPKGKAAKA